MNTSTWFLTVVGIFAAMLVPTLCDATTREYYVAAEIVSWDYAPVRRDLTHGGQLPEELNQRTVWEKVRFVEYRDADYKERTPQPGWLGILGPVLRAEVGDTVLVHFYNRADRPYSMHPHGLRYTKDDEGAHYIPAGRGAMVQPGERYTYTWTVDAMAGPGPRDASSVVWWYHSHVNEPEDIQKGLLGPIIMTRKGKATADGSPADVDREFVTAYMIFHEKFATGSVEMNSINGYIFGNLRGLEMKTGERVRWYVLGLGNETDLHTAHWHGETVETHGRHTDVVELLPGSMATATMTADNPGTWLYHCHVDEHLREGMHTRFVVKE